MNLQNSEKVALYLMNKKGFAVLSALLERFGAAPIQCVTSSPDPQTENDYYNGINTLCRKAGIQFYRRGEQSKELPSFGLAIGWRWMIKCHKKLIIFHDSLLPKYRGFAPLVSALINKEPFIGVTALFGGDEYDEGDIISQKSVPIESPLRIADAIEKLLPLYSTIAVDILGKILAHEKIEAHSQNHQAATYSLWRDEEDYQIDWNCDAPTILRKIYAVGFPYKGAFSYRNGIKIRILDAQIYPDVVIENRTPGKVIFLRNEHPVVVCGKGLLMITQILADGAESSKRMPFRSRFT